MSSASSSCVRARARAREPLFAERHAPSRDAPSESTGDVRVALTRPAGRWSALSMLMRVDFAGEQRAAPDRGRPGRRRAVSVFPSRRDASRLRRRIADAQAEHETIELRFRQREGACEVLRVLRRDERRNGSGSGISRRRSRPALRYARERGLRAGLARLISSARSTFAKIGLGERTKLRVALVVDETPRHRRKQIRCKLDASQFATTERASARASVVLPTPGTLRSRDGRVREARRARAPRLCCLECAFDGLPPASDDRKLLTEEGWRGSHGSKIAGSPGHQRFGHPTFSCYGRAPCAEGAAKVWALGCSPDERAKSRPMHRRHGKLRR